MKPFKWNFGALRDLDCGLCVGSGPVAGLITATTGSKFVHAFTFLQLRKQWVALEMNANGCEIVSLERYSERSKQCAEVWRWAGFDNPETREIVADYAMWLIRKRYDYRAFFRMPDVLAFLWKKKDDDKEMICSEEYFRILLKGGFSPAVWQKKRPPSPKDLRDIFEKSPQMSQVNFKLL